MAESIVGYSSCFKLSIKNLLHSINLLLALAKMCFLSNCSLYIITSMLRRVKLIWQGKELIWQLTLKEWKIKYHSIYWGFLSSLLTPLVLMIIFAVIFPRFMRFEIKNYPLYLLAGIFPWTFFSSSIASSSGSIIENRNLIKKVYFPKEILPISVNLLHLINFIFMLLILLVGMIILKQELSWTIVLFPVIVFFQCLLNLGFSLCLSAFAITHRYIKFIFDVTLPLLFYSAPIIYPVSFVSNKFLLTMLLLNPITPIISSYQNVLVMNSVPSSIIIFLTIFYSVFYLALGTFIFLKLEKKLADHV